MVYRARVSSQKPQALASLPNLITDSFRQQKCIFFLIVGPKRSGRRSFLNCPYVWVQEGASIVEEGPLKFFPGSQAKGVVMSPILGFPWSLMLFVNSTFNEGCTFPPSEQS